MYLASLRWLWQTKPMAMPKINVKSKRQQGKRRSWFVWLLRFIFRSAACFVILSILWVLLYRVVNPPITLLMIGNAFEGHSISKTWVLLDEMPPDLPASAIAAEDSKFCFHHGFDMQAIQKAMKANERGGAVRGGSTISQQTAKNVFLWPARSWLRKGFESWFTLLIEHLWSKHRIMEVYLNVAEWGPGIYGADAAADYYFDEDMSDLNRTQTARLVSILPSPLKWSPVRPSRRVARKSRNVRRAIPTVRNAMSGCLR